MMTQICTTWIVNDFTGVNSKDITNMTNYLNTVTDLLAKAKYIECPEIFSQSND